MLRRFSCLPVFAVLALAPAEASPVAQKPAEKAAALRKTLISPRPTTKLRANETRRANGCGTAR
jgi:hypothetical protein